MFNLCIYLLYAAIYQESYKIFFFLVKNEVIMGKVKKSWSRKTGQRADIQMKQFIRLPYTVGGWGSSITNGCLHTGQTDVLNLRSEKPCQTKDA